MHLNVMIAVGRAVTRMLIPGGGGVNIQYIIRHNKDGGMSILKTFFSNFNRLQKH